MNQKMGYFEETFLMKGGRYVLLGILKILRDLLVKSK